MGYGWGSDDDNYTRGGSGYDYSAARGAYGAAGTGSASRANATPAKGTRISTDSPNPLLIRIDVTGSNKANAAVFFEKLPLLYTEAARYLPELAISFAAVGDAYSDTFPLQVRDFRTGQELDPELKALFPEGGGGGQNKESYELSALYDLHCCDTPKAAMPFLFLLCDEAAYPAANTAQVKDHIGIDLAESMSTEEIYRLLMIKFNVYLLHSPYNGGGGDDNSIVADWKKLLGDERVLILDDATRVVDTIIGILAAYSGKFDDFQSRITDRQTRSQVASVMKTLSTVTKTIGKTDGKSQMPGTPSSNPNTKSKPLI